MLKIISDDHRSGLTIVDSMEQQFVRRKPVEYRCNYYTIKPLMIFRVLEGIVGNCSCRQRGKVFFFWTLPHDNYCFLQVRMGPGT